MQQTHNLHSDGATTACAPTKNPGGRPTCQTEENLQLMLEIIQDTGVSEQAAALAVGISITTLRRWKARCPKLLNQFTRARILYRKKLLKRIQAAADLPDGKGWRAALALLDRMGHWDEVRHSGTHKEDNSRDYCRHTPTTWPETIAALEDENALMAEEEAVAELEAQADEVEAARAAAPETAAATSFVSDDAVLTEEPEIINAQSTPAPKPATTSVVRAAAPAWDKDAYLDDLIDTAPGESRFPSMVFQSTPAPKPAITSCKA